jgi:Tfp pilus assembly protein PilP
MYKDPNLKRDTLIESIRKTFSSQKNDMRKPFDNQKRGAVLNKNVGNNVFTQDELGRLKKLIEKQNLKNGWITFTTNPEEMLKEFVKKMAEKTTEEMNKFETMNEFGLSAIEMEEILMKSFIERIKKPWLCWIKLIPLIFIMALIYYI